MFFRLKSVSLIKQGKQHTVLKSIVIVFSNVIKASEHIFLEEVFATLQFETKLALHHLNDFGLRCTNTFSFQKLS